MRKVAPASCGWPASAPASPRAAAGCLPLGRPARCTAGRVSVDKATVTCFSESELGLLWRESDTRCADAYCVAAQQAPVSARPQEPMPGGRGHVLLMQRGQLADVHWLAQSKVGELHVPAGVQQQVVRLYIPA